MHACVCSGETLLHSLFCVGIFPLKHFLALLHVPLPHVTEHLPHLDQLVHSEDQIQKRESEQLTGFLSLSSNFNHVQLPFIFIIIYLLDFVYRVRVPTYSVFICILRVEHKLLLRHRQISRIIKNTCYYITLQTISISNTSLNVKKK